jgi:O-antigen ligase
MISFFRRKNKAVYEYSPGFYRFMLSLHAKRRVLIIGALAIFCGVVLGALILQLSTELMVLAIIAFLIIPIFFISPEYIILIILGASSSIFRLNQIPMIKIRFSLSAIELSIILLLGISVLIVLGDIKNNFVSSPLNLPVALFFLASFISLINAVVSLGTDVNSMEYQWRILFNYCIFFVVTHLIRTRKQVQRLVLGLFIIALVVVAAMMIQQLLGSSVAILPGRVETATDQQPVEVTRILPPGQGLIFVMFLPALIIFSLNRGDLKLNRVALIVALLLIAGIAFTFNRSFWMSIAFGVVVLFFITQGKFKKNIINFFLILLILALISLPLLNIVSSVPTAVLKAVLARFGTLFSSDTSVGSSSWQWRMMEIEYAVEPIAENLFFGIGPGADYRPRLWSSDNLTGYVHNAYVFILLDLGLFGLITFLWLSLVFLIRGFRNWVLIQDQYLKAIALGFTLSYLCCLLVGVANPIFFTWFWTPVLGLMFGLNEVIYKLELDRPD